MSLPASFTRDGFLHSSKVLKKRRLMIGTEGDTDAGKTEFILSCPGPGILLAVDRSIDGVYDNPAPPPSRRDDWAIVPVTIPLNTQLLDKDAYMARWTDFYKNYYMKALNNEDAVSVALDGDSDTWEFERLASWGRLEQIPALMYAGANSSRRAMISRAWDSGKIIIATNKLKDEYVDILDSNGKPVKDDKGRVKREKTGEQERQGFPDQQYLWQIQLRHLYKAPELLDFESMPIAEKLKAKREKRTATEPQWGIRITKCKANKRLEGAELWGDQCNFTGLVQFIYPQVELSEWGL